MKLAVKGVNLTISPSLRRYAEEKLVEPVQRLLASHPAFSAATLDLELVCGTRHHKKGNVWGAVANLGLPGETLWKKSTADDIHSAIDDLEGILKREIKKYKERSRSRLLRGARQVKKELRFSRSARLYRTGRIREEGI